MKISENKSKTVSIRMNEQDFRLLQYVSFMAGMNVSKYIRTICDATVNAVKLEKAKGRLSDEDIKTVLDNKL